MIRSSERANSAVIVAGPRQGTTSRLTPGACSPTRVASSGRNSSAMMSGIIRRKRRWLRAASNVSVVSSSRTWSSVCVSGARSDWARGVNSIRAPTRTSSGSSSIVRSRCKAWLVAGCDRPMRSAARLTLASVSSASRATRRFRSSELKFMA